MGAAHLHRLASAAVLATLVALARPALAAGGTVAEATFTSAALAGPLTYSYYLPPSYGDGRRYPTVYLLHGYGGKHRDWLKAGGLARTADRLIADGGIKPLIVVMPGAGNRWYVNTPEIGPSGMMEDAINGDLVAHVEAHFATIAAREGRALAGLSMGGYGALRLAYFHPRRYVAAASLSGAIFTGARGETWANPVFERRGQRKLFGNAFGEPFDLDRYRAANVFAALEQARAPLPAAWIASGDDDYFGLYRGAMAAWLALRAAGAKAELRITDGKHSWKLWREEIGPALRFLSRHLAKPAP